MRLLWAKPSKPADHLDELIQKAEKKLGIAYSAQQRKAIEATFQYNLHVITGYPGTGKTTVLRGILYVQNALKKDATIHLCSPTGRAARRMTETTGHGAQTIHSLLGLHGDEPVKTSPRSTIRWPTPKAMPLRRPRAPGSDGLVVWIGKGS